MSGLRILVCGGRHFSDWLHMVRVLDSEQFDVLVQGECPTTTNADKLAKLYCIQRGKPCIGMEAAWTKLGRAAGPIRNRWMLDFAGPIDKVIAFPGDRGTANMIEQAAERGILVRDERRAILASLAL